ncbi:MAG: hypothetical protein GY769_22350 [bacterium]|nr:hypothetical protein [bacterium]
MRNIPTGAGGGYGFGLSGPVPRDVWILLGIVFATFSMRFFEVSAPLAELLRLTPRAWRSGFLWQLVTYPFAGTGAPGFWFVIELLILFLFARTVFYQLGRRKFWRLLVLLSLSAALAAVAVDLIGSLLAGGPAWQVPFALMQGQRMLLVLLIALFAVLNRNATILLFFVLPVQAKWFLLLEIVFAFLGFLGTKDLPGFIGICAGVGVTVAYFGRGQGAGLLGGAFRELWLRAQAAWFRLRLARLKQKRGMQIVPDDRDGHDQDDWVH